MYYEQWLLSSLYQSGLTYKLRVNKNSHIYLFGLSDQSGLHKSIKFKVKMKGKMTVPQAYITKEQALMSCFHQVSCAV